MDSKATIQLAGFSAPPPGAPAAAAPGFSLQVSDFEIARLFESGRSWVMLASFFGFGILLAFTPCVLPMIPILSGIIAGEGRDLGKLRALLLSLSYVLGMAVTYAAAGIAAAWSGSLLAGALQNVWVLCAFALVFVVLAFSMFGFYELQLPGFLHHRLHATHGKLRGGRVASVAAMGALSAIVVSPCVAAPLAAALLHISRTGDVALGGSALFAMALGMGVPLLVVGVSEGALLPKSGPWMVRVKHVFGVLLLAVALWIVWPVLLPSGGSTQFVRVQSIAELEQKLQSPGKPVMLDFYADWCVSCKEMEALTFSDARVKPRMDGMLLLQADVTGNSAEHKALLKRFHLFGPPGIIFFDAQGKELQGLRVIGYQNAERFLKTLELAGAP
jgi:thiol:disulfide interchange protein DsbD